MPEIWSLTDPLCRSRRRKVMSEIEGQIGRDADITSRWRLTPAVAMSIRSVGSDEAQIIALSTARPSELRCRGIIKKGVHGSDFPWSKTAAQKYRAD